MNISRINDFDIPENQYIGLLCAHKHEYGNTGKTLRYKATSTCCLCKKERGRTDYKKDKARMDANNRQWAKNNPEKTKAYKKKYRETHRDAIRHRDGMAYRADKERHKAYARRYRGKNLEKYKLYGAKYHTFHHANLTDRYMAQVLHIPIKEVKKYEELIEVKKVNLLIKRELKERKKPK